MKFYKRDPDRALAGMNELTFEQRGAYNSLIDLLYSRDGDVPDDDVRVAKMIGAHWRTWGKLKNQLIEIGKVWIKDGKLHAKRVQETITEAAEFGQEQSRKAAEGWQTRRKSGAEMAQEGRRDGAEVAQESKKPNKNNVTQLPLGNALTPIDTPTPTPTPRGSDSDSKESESGRLPPADAPLIAFRPDDGDWSRALFGPGLQYLIRHSGQSEKECRSFLGMMRQRMSRLPEQKRSQQLYDYLQYAQEQKVAQPIEYVAKLVANWKERELRELHARGITTAF